MLPYKIILLYISLFLFPFLFYSKLVLFNYTPGGDAYFESFPFRYYLGKMLTEGNFFPLWMDELNFGHPFAAEIQNSLLYPPTLLYSLIAYHFGYIAWQSDLLFHLGAFNIGFYLYYKELGFQTRSSVLAAFSITFGGFTFSHLGHNSMIHTLSFTPYLFLYSRRIFLNGKRFEFIIFAILLTFSFLSGSSPLFFLQCLFILLYFLFYCIFSFKTLKHLFIQWKKNLINIFLLLLIFLPFFLFQFGLSYPLYSTSGRTAWPEMMYFGFRTNLFSLFHLVYGLDWFRFHPFPGVMEVYIYPGLVLILLPFFGFISKPVKKPETFFFLFLFILGIIFSHALNPLYYFVFKHIPGFSAFRVPGRYLFFSLLAQIYFSCIGLEKLSETRHFSKKTILLILFSFLFLAILPFYKNTKRMPLNFSNFMKNLEVYSLLGISYLSFILFYLKPKRLSFIFLSTSLFIGLFLNHNRFTRFQPYPTSTNPNQRIYSFHETNFPLISGSPDAGGILSLESLRTYEFKQKLKVVLQSKQESSGLFFASAVDPYKKRNFAYGLNKILYADKKNLLEALSQSKQTCPVYTENKELENNHNETCIGLELLKKEPFSEYEIRIPKKESLSFLYVSLSYYPGWKAYCDKKEVPIYRANYNF
ncbi:MAG: hypothetical protein KDK45_20625, partial [Leptospiraceae bacterium]|nr:hypothetical protein [Leptospiraceae bacterium]